MVPPVADAVHVTAVPAVPLAGQLMVAVSASGVTVIVLVALPFCGVGVVVSLTFKVTVKVPFDA